MSVCFLAFFLRCGNTRVVPVHEISGAVSVCIFAYFWRTICWRSLLTLLCWLVCNWQRWALLATLPSALFTHSKFSIWYIPIGVARQCQHSKHFGLTIMAANFQSCLLLFAVSAGSKSGTDLLCHSLKTLTIYSYFTSFNGTSYLRIKPKLSQTWLLLKSFRDLGQYSTPAAKNYSQLT